DIRASPVTVARPRRPESDARPPRALPSSRSRSWLPVAAVLAALAPAAPAAASGFDAPALSHGQSSPVARDAAAVHYTPGQLGYLDRTELDVGLGLIFGSIGYQRDRRGQYQYGDNFDFAEPIDPADLDPSRTGLTEPVRAIPVGPVVDAFVA